MGRRNFMVDTPATEAPVVSNDIPETPVAETPVEPAPNFMEAPVTPEPEPVPAVQTLRTHRGTVTL